MRSQRTVRPDGGVPTLSSESTETARAQAPSSLVLDGGLATLLEELGFDTSGPLWSARALVDAADLIAAAQIAFVQAGAECVATATYQATVPGLQRHGLARAPAERLIADSVAAARRTLVAASVGPFGAALADGSEYRGDYGVSPAELDRFHRPRLRLLIEGEPDLIAFETVPSALEARVLVELLDGLDTPAGAWLSLSLRDERTLADGSPLEGRWLEELVACPKLLALGVNCVPPQWVAPALAHLPRRRGLTYVVYPNSGEQWSGGSWRERDGEPLVMDALRDRVESWWNAGARWIGGCCRTGPRQVAEVAQEVARLRQRES
jgi:homocysteine S-methyltransferase